LDVKNLFALFSISDYIVVASMGLKIPAVFVEMATFFEPTKMFRDSGSGLRLNASLARGYCRSPGGNPPVTAGSKKPDQRHYGGDFFLP